jgi:hypothetical protein
VDSIFGCGECRRERVDLIRLDTCIQSGRSYIRNYDKHSGKVGRGSGSKTIRSCREFFLGVGALFDWIRNSVTLPAACVSGLWSFGGNRVSSANKAGCFDNSKIQGCIFKILFLTVHFLIYSDILLKMGVYVFDARGNLYEMVSGYVFLSLVNPCYEIETDIKMNVLW